MHEERTLDEIRAYHYVHLLTMLEVNCSSGMTPHQDHEDERSSCPLSTKRLSLFEEICSENDFSEQDGLHCSESPIRMQTKDMCSGSFFGKSFDLNKVSLSSSFDEDTLSTKEYLSEAS